MNARRFALTAACTLTVWSPEAWAAPPTDDTLEGDVVGDAFATSAPPAEGAPAPEAPAPEAPAPDAPEDGGDEGWGDAEDGGGGDDGFSMEDAEGDAPAEGDWSETEEEVMAPTVSAPAEDEEGGDGDGDDGWDDVDPEDDGGFTFEDISDDPEALQDIMQGEQKQAQGVTGSVKGKVIGTDGQPIFGAIIEVVGKDFVTYADVNGDYELKLKPGKYELRIRADEFGAERIPDVEIAANQAVELDSTLKPLGEQQVVTVEAEINKEGEAGRLIERKKDVVARDVISAEEIGKSGGGSTAGVARRVVGATVVDGKYVYVRGLGHRYGNTLMDRSRVPSPDPNRRSVPLDIFPSGALSAINIQKTFSPDVPGDFAGGSVQLETRGIPEDPVVKASVEVGFNTQTTFQSGLRNRRYGLADAFAFGNRPRGLPSIIPADKKIDRNAVDDNFNPIWTPEQIETFGEAFDTDGSLRPIGTAPPNYGVKFTVGNGWQTKRAGRIGALLSAGYKDSLQTQRGTERRIYGLGTDPDTGEDALQIRTDYDELRTTREVGWNSLGLFRWDINDDQRLELSGFYSRQAEDEARRLEGFANDVIDGSPVRTERARYEMRSVAMGRLGGRHKWDAGKVEDMQFDWFGSIAQARMDQPALREMVYTDASNNGSYNLDIANGAGSQLFQGLIDNQENGAVDFTVPFRQWSGLESEFKFGAWAEGKQREFGARRFSYKLSNGYGLNDFDATDPSGINDQSIGNGLGPMNGGTGPLQVFEPTRPQDNYRGDQTIFAGYLKMSLPFTWWFKLSGGARLEANNMEVRPFDIFLGEDLEDLKAEVDDLDVLPVASFIFSPRREKRDMNIRLTGTRTLARPEFRELAPFAFKDFSGGVDVVGNADLKTTKIWNADLRWEWFPQAQDVLAASVFYKFMDDPIEVVRLAGANLQTFQNADRAQLAGFELEARKGLGFMTQKARRNWLRDFSIGANFSYVFSRVELAECAPDDDECVPDVTTNRNRPLQGLSPWVANAYLDYTNDDSGTFVRLLYNGKAPSLATLGRNGLPDIYNSTYHSLDLNFSQRIVEVHDWMGGDFDYETRHQLNWDFSITNLLDQRLYEVQRGADDWRVRRDGLTFTTGLSYSF